MSFDKKLQKKINSITDSDFIDGVFIQFAIMIQDSVDSKPYQYMQTSWTKIELAEQEKDRIIKHKEKHSISMFKIWVEPIKVRRLKNPISVS